MSRIINFALALLAIPLALLSEARAQTFFGGWGVNTYVSGGGLPNNPGGAGGLVQDISIILRASSGNANADGSGNGSGYINWAFNEAWTVTVQGLDYGYGLNWPFIVLRGYDDYGNWDWVIIELGEWWPNDNNPHTMSLQLLQAGYEGNVAKDLNVTMDGRHMSGASITSDGNSGSVLHIALYTGGDFSLGYNTRVGISRFNATEGVYPSPYAAPVYVQGGDLTQNMGYGNNLVYIPEVTYEIQFGDDCPGC
jgi:hypothetical protein